MRKCNSIAALALALVLGACVGPRVMDYQSTGRTVETDPATGDTVITEFWRFADGEGPRRSSEFLEETPIRVAKLRRPLDGSSIDFRHLAMGASRNIRVFAGAPGPIDRYLAWPSSCLGGGCRLCRGASAWNRHGGSRI